MDSLGGADLVIVAAACGCLNPEHASGPDRETVSVNVIGFMALAQAAFRLFQARGHGHLAAITSIAALQGSSDGTAYAASKAFQNRYTWMVCERRRNSLKCRLPLPNCNRVLWTRR